ncbi:helix-turn-helix transcriptional regulator [Massilia sp. R2A-15]|uniref:helix-turn-helix transcriptional regulator n=1 Tax=Massilia sp. R2A-15 TaxID=3064278 RepID=UPI0027364633|nr:helix-turn-helix transcriptional regulator [Massilia sp. R2A-15]WLI91102.1 helix-turn-helix transcriptional regulator [Massilia sp. R2A-15]
MGDTEVLALAGSFYDGILAPRGWDEALRKITAATGSQAACLVVWDRRRDQGMVGEQIGLPPELSEEYARHYHWIDPARAWVDQQPLGGWYLDERDLGAGVMRRAPFYQDFLCRYELDSTMTAPVVRDSVGHDGFLTLSSRMGMLDQAPVARRLQTLMPHIQRAARLRSRLLALTQPNFLLHDVLDRVSMPLIIVDMAGHPVLSNRPGSAWLSRPEQPFTVRSPIHGKVLSAVTRACGAGARVASIVRLQQTDGRPVFLNVIPLPDTWEQGWKRGGPSALVVVIDISERQPEGGTGLHELFGLSPAEVRLVEQLRRGLSLKEAADTLQISVNTARTQLKGVFAKLGIRRQTELHMLLGRLEVFDPL